MNHNILDRQNEEKYLSYLSAQRQLYDEEKRWISTWIVVVALVGLVGTGFLATIKEFKPYIAVISGLLLILEVIFLWRIKQKGTNAASIQELFDCELLDMGWNEILAKKPGNSVIKDAAERYARVTPADEAHRLKNWYSSRIASMPLHQARLSCQMENIQWDLKQRKEYVVWVAGAWLILALALVVFSLATNMTAQVFFAGPFLLTLPLFGMGIEHIYDHWKAITRMTELKQLSDSLWLEASRADADPARLAKSSRELQNEIFHQRADSLPVFSWFYKIIRDKYERNMKD